MPGVIHVRILPHEPSNCDSFTKTTANVASNTSFL